MCLPEDNKKEKKERERESESVSFKKTDNGYDTDSCH